MYFFEWGFWQVCVEAKRKKGHETNRHNHLKKIDVYESDAHDSQAAAQESVSQTPKARGPVYVFDDVALEMRCGTQRPNVDS